MADAHDSAEWRVIPGFPDYAVSDDGRVRRITPSKGPQSRRAVPFELKLALKQKDRDLGYYSAALRRDGKTHHITVHRLVALAFLGGPPSPRHQVAHNDGVSTNNRVENLRWATCTENQRDRFTHGTSNRGEGHGASRLTEAQVREIRARRAAGERNRDLGPIYGVNENTISNIVTRKKWRHVE